MIRGLWYNVAVALTFVSSPVWAGSPNQIRITVHTSTGDREHLAPTVGQAPISLERAMQAAGITYTATWFPNVPGYAAMIIDGDPSKTNGDFGTPFWWACIDGYSSAAGLQTLIRDGMHVEWSLLSELFAGSDRGGAAASGWPRSIR